MSLKTPKWKLVRRILTEYCAENFVFAVRFLADRRLRTVERSWWLFWIGASFVACCFAVTSMYHMYYESPVVIAYAPRFLPISRIPFPAITICPLSKTRIEEFDLTHAFAVVSNGSTLDEDSEIKLRTLAHVCPTATQWKTFDERSEKQIVRMLRKMNFPIEMTLPFCIWKSLRVSCNEFISETVVDDGICYTFNAIPPNELYRSEEISPDFINLRNAANTTNWSQEEGYARNAGVNVYPQRSLASGLSSGLQIIASIRIKDQEFICTGPYTGYKILVHTPDEVVQTEERFYRLNTLNALTISLTPRITYTSQSLSIISPYRRNCFFNNERHLRFFKIYNQINCFAECKANITLAKCGCVKFSMVRAANTKLCDASKIKCYNDISLEMFRRVAKAIRTKQPTPCSCYPACNTVEYDAEISQFPFYFHEYAEAAWTGSDEHEDVDPAALFIFYKERHFLPLWRRELLGFVDVVAKFGGLFALLMGASVMSLGEILYYCCIRSLRRERVPKFTTKNMQPEGTRRTTLLRILREYLTENLVFGIRFIANQRLLKWERSWWALWIVASLAACGFYVVNTYNRWYENPVVIAYAPRFMPISSVPFPAITLCPLSKTRVEVLNFSDVYDRWKQGDSLNSDREMKLRSLAHVCPTAKFWNTFDYHPDEQVVQNLRNIAIPLGTTMKLCRRGLRKFPCSEIMSESLTADGICYTFNALPVREIYRVDEISADFLNFKGIMNASGWTQEKGYHPRAGVNAYPYRSLSRGGRAGIFLLPAIRTKDQEFLCKGPFTGFKIIVHTPDEVAESEDRFFRLNTKNAIIISLQTREIFTLPELRKMPPARRNCFFNNERYLRYFKIYNQMNCVAECVSNFTLARCGCVKFSMPRSATTKVCAASEINCYSNISQQIYERLVKAQLNHKHTPCQCYPACNTVQYDVEIFQYPLDLDRFRMATGIYMNQFKEFEPTIVFIFFKDRHYLPLWRRELYGVADAVAKFGGLFALLMGASVMSLGEIMFYCCIRPLRRERSRFPIVIEVTQTVQANPTNNKTNEIP